MFLKGISYGLFYFVAFAVGHVTNKMINNIGTEKQNMRFIDVAMDIYEEGNIEGLFKGLFPAIIVSTPFYFFKAMTS